MPKSLTLIALVTLILPVASLSQASPNPKDCSAYFGVIQYEPRAPGSYIARMSDSQAKWYANQGRKQYPAACLSLEKAQYLIVWTTSTRTRSTQQTVQRTAQVHTETTGSEDGTFSTYGSLATWGTYSGTTSSSSRSTVRYEESVPVSVTTDYCFVYVLKSVAPTVWDDIRSKTSEQPAVFVSEARGRPRVSGGSDSAASTAGLLIGSAIRRAVTKEPTARAFEAALKFVSEQTPAHYASESVPRESVPREQIVSHASGRTQPVDTPVQPVSGAGAAVGKVAPQAPAPLQVDPASEAAVAALRGIARAIEKCPAEGLFSVERWGKKPTEIRQLRQGPPEDVTWDFLPGSGVSPAFPHMGYIEFATRWELWVPPGSLLKHNHDPGRLNLRIEVSHWAPWRYRYEFDVGPGGLELTRVVCRKEEGGWKSEVPTSCWGRAAQQGQTASAKGKQ
jgi:hypothetical protein